MAVFISRSREQTQAFATEYAKSLKGGDIVLLDGDMGAGKTVFAKGVAQGLGVQEEVTSPTYAYLNIYGDYIYHYDFYRLSSGEEAELLGLNDYFNGENVCVFEWAKNVEEILPKNVKTVMIEKISEKERRITF